MLIFDDPQKIADWVAAQLGSVAPSVDAAIGYDRGRGLEAGVYFDAMNANNIFAHIASKTDGVPISLLRAVGTYVFRELKLDRLSFAVPQDNSKTVSFVLALGAKLEARLKHACGKDNDLLIFVLWSDAPLVHRVLGQTNHVA